MIDKEEMDGPRHNSTNFTNSNETNTAVYSGEMAKIEIIVQAIILYFTIFGNAVVLIVFRWKLKRLSRMQWFIVHLCIADIFVGFFNILHN